MAAVKVARCCRLDEQLATRSGLGQTYVNILKFTWWKLIHLNAPARTSFGARQIGNQIKLSKLTTGASLSSIASLKLVGAYLFGWQTNNYLAQF